MISLFFLAITAPGFCLNKIVGLLKERTKAYSLLSIALGLLLIWIAPLEWLIIPGCLLVGLGYGVISAYVVRENDSCGASTEGNNGTGICDDDELSGNFALSFHW